MKNACIKIAMVECDLRQWQVARLMGIHEGTLSRKMREEMPLQEQEKIVDLIRHHVKTESGGKNHA